MTEHPDHNHEPSKHLLVGIPMQEELNILVRTWEGMGFRAEDSCVGRLPVKHFPDLNTTITRGGIGKVRYAVKMQHLLDGCTHRDMLICAGTAGSLINGLNAGDVVVATTIIEHDVRTLSPDLRSPVYETQDSLVNVFRQVNVPREDLFSIHSGAIASGDEVICDSQRRCSLSERTGALAVAMEGAGGARACRFSDVPFLEIRGLTDAADQRIATHFLENLEPAMRHVAIVLALAIPALRHDSFHP
ncbi:MAG TPA: hypothetical protein ENN34_09515 [Deltaproteobacteria bacterium]|nr:hypothetical protein [Deltaproteobacteria bacterium]